MTENSNALSDPASDAIRLRDVIPSDLPIFFEQQRDPGATQMSAVPARDWDAFTAHWAKILADASIILQTIEVTGVVVGNLVSFERAGQREVGYWLDRAYWGRGIATRALVLFLPQIATRPLYATVATHNHASRRVLEKCGFTITDQRADVITLRLDDSHPKA